MIDGTRKMYRIKDWRNGIRWQHTTTEAKTNVKRWVPKPLKSVGFELDPVDL